MKAHHVPLRQSEEGIELGKGQEGGTGKNDTTEEGSEGPQWIGRGE